MPESAAGRVVLIAGATSVSGLAATRALVAAGRDSEALQAYQRAREALADALGVDPSPDLAALHVALLRGELERGEPKPERREAGRRTNLRAELTTFVGKGADVAAVRELVAEHRLTTLIGPGGAGKTRLATETARTLLDDCGGFDPAHPRLAALQRRVSERLHKAIGLAVEVRLVEPRTIPRSEGKAVRVVERGDRPR